MVVVTTVSAVVVAVINILVWDEVMFKIVVVVRVLVIGVLTDVEIIVVVDVLEFALIVPYSVDMSSEVFFDLFMDASVGVILTRIGLEMLADVNTFSVLMTALGCPVLPSLTEFSGWAAFDCRPPALLDCARVLQTWMPSYHV